MVYCSRAKEKTLFSPCLTLFAFSEFPMQSGGHPGLGTAHLLPKSDKSSKTLWYPGNPFDLKSAGSRAI